MLDLFLCCLWSFSSPILSTYCHCYQLSSCIYVHRFIDSLIHWFVDSFIDVVFCCGAAYRKHEWTWIKRRATWIEVVNTPAQELRFECVSFSFQLIICLKYPQIYSNTIQHNLFGPRDRQYRANFTCYCSLVVSFGVCFSNFPWFPQFPQFPQSFVSHLSCHSLKFMFHLFRHRKQFLFILSLQLKPLLESFAMGLTPSGNNSIPMLSGIRRIPRIPFIHQMVIKKQKLQLFSFFSWIY